MASKFALAFDPQGMIVPIASILPLKQLKLGVRSSQKYQQVLVFRARSRNHRAIDCVPAERTVDAYLLLDGHVRLEVLKQFGETHARCLISTDDETYTYNKRVNRMATIQEHAMILKAIGAVSLKNGSPRYSELDVGEIRAEARSAEWHLQGGSRYPQEQARVARSVFSF